MSSVERATSYEEGAPIFYYDFIRGTTHWRYNTSPTTRAFGGYPYYSANITHGNIQQGSDRALDMLPVTMPSDTDVVDNWRPFAPNDPVGLTIYELHDGETTPIVRWIGKIIEPEFQPGEVTFACEPSSTTGERSGLSQAWQPGCPHVLYKQGHGLCNADRASKEIEATLTDVTGATVTAPEFGVYSVGSKLRGGFIEWVTPGGWTERRTVIAQAGNVLTLFYPADLTNGMDVIGVPGCRHDWADCNDFHDNAPNYGGDPFGPRRSPFDGNPVY